MEIIQIDWRRLNLWNELHYKKKDIPLGSYILPPALSIDKWTGIDHTTGEFYVEEWPTEELCRLWLKGKIEPPYLCEKGEFPLMEKLMREAGENK